MFYFVCLVPQSESNRFVFSCFSEQQKFIIIGLLRLNSRNKQHIDQTLIPCLTFPIDQRDLHRVLCSCMLLTVVEPICFKTIKIHHHHFDFAMFNFVLPCSPIRVEPICFVIFFRTIKIHHQHIGHRARKYGHWRRCSV